MSAIKITFGNFKGGTGKTTNCTMIGYTLAKRGFKVLVLDQDPQANATSLYLKTKIREEGKQSQIESTLMTAIASEDLSSIVTPISENLFLLPSFADYTSLPRYLERKYPNDFKARSLFLTNLIKPLEKDFDFILIDVPPTVSVYTDSALLASDYTVVVLQTQERSLEGAENFVQYLQELINNYDANFDIIGILPVLLKNNAAVDLNTLAYAKEKFGEENLFKTIVKNMERLKRYDVVGIINPLTDDKSDIHDKRVFELYEQVTDEFLTRIQREETRDEQLVTKE
ncbi:putative ATPase [Bacillus sp. TS-2]|nr:putative ATPase [Bacillus sp. TS-2]